MNKWTRITLAALALITLCSAGAAPAQNVDVGFRWTASRNIVTGQAYQPSELDYMVYIKRGNGAEEYLTTVRDTIYVLSAEPGVVQRIRVMAVDANGNESPMSEWSDPIFFQENGGGPGVLPSRAQLKPNHPNPFNPMTAISYGVPIDVAAGDRVQLDIYTLQGQHVRSFQVDRSPGWHEVIWDGTNADGQVMAAGMYITRFAVGAMVETGKMTMLK